jgi:hypothetical protein
MASNRCHVEASGWLMVTVACLSIESLSAFMKGVSKLQNGGEEFTAFFKKHAAFGDLLKAFPAFERKGKNGKPKMDNKFYSDIRCGLLHQGGELRWLATASWR